MDPVADFAASITAGNFKKSEFDAAIAHAVTNPSAEMQANITGFVMAPKKHNWPLFLTNCIVYSAAGLVPVMLNTEIQHMFRLIYTYNYIDKVALYNEDESAQYIAQILNIPPEYMVRKDFDFQSHVAANIYHFIANARDDIIDFDESMYEQFSTIMLDNQQYSKMPKSQKLAIVIQACMGETAESAIKLTFGTVVAVNWLKQAIVDILC